MIRCLVDGKVDTVIWGYAPGPNGRPLAMVVWPIDKGYGLEPVELCRIRLTNLPEKLRRRLGRYAKSKISYVPLGPVSPELYENLLRRRNA